MNCREFLIEFEERGSLTETARLHLTVCTDCKKTSERQTQIWLLIDDLQPVAAPSDFDFHVKAKIANAKPSDFQTPAFIPILRYVLPMSFAALLFGGFAFNYGLFSTDPNASPIAQTETIAPTVIKDLPINSSLSNRMAFAPSNTDKMVVEAPIMDEKIYTGANVSANYYELKSGRNRNNETAQILKNKTSDSPKKPVVENESFGNRLYSANSATVYYPANVSPNPSRLPSTNVDQAKPTEIEQDLEFFGIGTAMENGKRTVKSLQKDKQGERSGVKIGDIIEQMKGNNLTILRGTEKIEINLR